MNTFKICKLHADIQFYYADYLLARVFLANSFKMVIWQCLVLTAWMAEKLSALLHISYWDWSQCYQRRVSFSAVKNCW